MCAPARHNPRRRPEKARWATRTQPRDQSRRTGTGPSTGTGTGTGTPEPLYPRPRTLIRAPASTHHSSTDGHEP